MKICLYLQRNFAPVGHAIAAVIKDKYGADNFCAYAGTRTAFDFIRSNEEIKYSSILLDEEIFEKYKNEKIDWDFLRNFEKEYGIPNLWPYLKIDRIIMQGQSVHEYPYDKSSYTYEEMLRIMQVMAKEIMAFLKREKPDVAFFSVVSSLGSMLFYHIAKKLGIKTLVIFPCLLENRHLISSRFDRFSLYEEPGKNACKNVEPKFIAEAKKFIESFRDRPRPYFEEFTPDRQAINRRRQFHFIKPLGIWRSVSALIYETKKYFSDFHHDDYTKIKPWYFVIDRFKRKIRNLIGASDLYDKTRAGENFAYFPLQYEPEATLLGQAPFMNNQIEAVKLAARSLPVGWKLYVKEHPQMVEYRPRAFYKKIKKVPNVVLVDPSIKSFDLIEKTRLVLTINDTGGFEACLMKKPVITLGDHFIDDLSFVRHCKTPEELPELVKSQAENFGYDEEELTRYIAMMIKESAYVDLIKLWYKESDFQKKKEGITPLADLLAKKLGLVK